MSERVADPPCNSGGDSRHHYSFVVRCWVVAPDRLRCKVVDTDTGLVYPLTSPDELPDLLARLTHASGAEGADP